MKRLQLTVCLMLVLVVECGPANSALLVDNTDSSTIFTPTTTDTDHYFAGRFTTGASASWLITSAQARLTNVGGSAEATYEATIWTDVAGSMNSPGSILYTFDTNPTLNAGTGFTKVEFTDPGLLLAADTSYWLGIRLTAGNYLGWGATFDNTEFAQFGWTIDDDGFARGGNPDWDVVFGDGTVPQFSISGTAAVPEPGSALLLGLIGTGAFWRHRRRRVAAE